MDSKARRQLKGPKPSALLVSKNYSTKIKKQIHLPHQVFSPVIVHLRTPKVIHVRPEEFMGIVQQLTGKPMSTSSGATHSPSDPGSSMKITPRQKMEKDAILSPWLRAK